MTFDDTCDSLIATWTVDAEGRLTSNVFLFDGHEISAEEYAAIQIAALDRHLEGAR